VDRLTTILARLFTAAFSVLALAALVDDRPGLCWCFGVATVAVPWTRWYRARMRRTRKYDSTFPPAIDDVETLPAEEASQTRRIGGSATVAEGKRGAA
jgi:Flp pilus assembly protein TadB